MTETCILTIDQIKVSADAADGDIISLAAKQLRRAGLDPRKFKLNIHKRSVDARHRNNIMIVASVLAEGSADGLPDAAALSRFGIRLADVPEMTFPRGAKKLNAPPVVVGFGPAGMFAALMLAREGYRPVVLERGGSVEDRARAVAEFYRSGKLDANSNIQFGAGGAGTFSDGKLTTRINDPKCAYVLRTFTEFGAPADILHKAKPHIGTDKLRGVVEAVSQEIERLGGEVRYYARMAGIDPAKRCIRVENTADGGFYEMPYGVLLLATGHSARDVYKILMEGGFSVAPKPFSVGVRIEHRQTDIDRIMYGDPSLSQKLGHAEYVLSHRRGERGVYSFCMCPGGEVVAAASEEGGVVVNGMSEYARNGRNANAALAVSVLPSDYGDTPHGAIAFQRSLEKAAFEAGGRNYRAPLQTIGDFYDGKAVHEPTDVIPTYMGGGKYTVCDLNRILPDFVSDYLKEGLRVFGRKMPGFDNKNIPLTGIETRTSAPVRILRNDDRTAIGFSEIYPCGEGAGYAGGIMSAAVDGIGTALAVMSVYAPDFN